MDNTRRLAAGRRDSPVGGLQAALGRTRSPRGKTDVPQLQGSSPQSPAAASPIIPGSSPDIIQQLQPTLKASQQPVAPSRDSETTPDSGPNLIALPGLLSSDELNRMSHQVFSLPTHSQTPPEQCLRTAGTLPTSFPGGAAHPMGDGASSLTRSPVRGSLATAMATASSVFPQSGSDGMNPGDPGCDPFAVAYSQVAPHDSSSIGVAAVLAAPPAITPLSSSLSQGFRQGLPSWLQESAVQAQPHLHSPSHAQPQALPYPQLLQSHPQQQQQQPPSQHPQQPKRSPFLPSPQVPRSPYHTTPVGTGVAAAAAAAAQQLHLARSLPAGGFGAGILPYPDAARLLPNAAAGHGYHLTNQQRQSNGTFGQRHGPGATGPVNAAQLQKESQDEAGVMGDTPARGALTRGRSGMPRVASISEIEPVLEVEEPSRQRLSKSLLTRAISIPNAHGDDRPRTYRVALAKSHGSHEDVTVVLEGADVGSGSGRGARGGGSTHGSYYSYDSSAGGGGGGGRGVMGAASALSTSMLNSSFLGSLFGSRTAGGGGGGLGRTAGGAGGLFSPDRSVHGDDLMPFAGRDRLYQNSDNDLYTSFGSLPTSSLLRSRANASAGSVLSKATGGLNTVNTKAIKRSVSYQQFGSAALFGGAGGGSGAANGATDMPPSSSGTWLRGRRAPQTSINGGSDSTSTSASVSAGLGNWLRGGGGWGAGVAAGGRGGGAGSDSDGAVVRQVPAARRRAEPDLADLAVLATSLPASLGTWSLPRSMALASSPTTGTGNAIYGSVGIAGGVHGGGRRGNMSCDESNASGSAHVGGAAVPPAGAAPPAAGPGGGFPICLICLEVLTPEEFESGDAISLQCACKGEMSLRHRKCAIEWSHHKGDVDCDICKQGIANLPPIPPEILAAREAARRRRQPAFNIAAEPNLADFCFDCIRATWVTMIVCVLFFDVSVGQAFMLGLLVGLAFMFVSMVIAACARRARALAAARAVERAAAESRAQEQRWRQQQNQHHTGSGLGSRSGFAAGPSGGSEGGAGQPLGSQGGSSGGGARRSLTSEPSLMVPLLAAADVP